MTTSLARAIIGTSMAKSRGTLLMTWTSFLPPSSGTSKGSIVKTVTLDVRPPTEAMADFAQAWKTGKGSKTDRISFASPELLWKVLSAKRWELLKALCGAGPITVREAARRVGRDVKAVHTDLSALLRAGVLSRTEWGQVEFPYDAVKVEFLLQAA
jgi:predicted transcriptional regulator